MEKARWAFTARSQFAGETPEGEMKKATFGVAFECSP